MRVAWARLSAAAGAGLAVSGHLARRVKATKASRARALARRGPSAAWASSAWAAWRASVLDASITVHGKPGPGAISGRHFRQGRKAAASACAGVWKKRQFSRFGVRTRQIGRQ